MRIVLHRTQAQAGAKFVPVPVPGTVLYKYLVLYSTSTGSGHSCRMSNDEYARPPRHAGTHTGRCVVSFHASQSANEMGFAISRSAKAQRSRRIMQTGRYSYCTGTAGTGANCTQVRRCPCVCSLAVEYSVQYLTVPRMY